MLRWNIKSECYVNGKRVRNSICKSFAQAVVNRLAYCSGEIGAVKYIDLRDALHNQIKLLEYWRGKAIEDTGAREFVLTYLFKDDSNDSYDIVYAYLLTDKNLKIAIADLDQTIHKEPNDILLIKWVLRIPYTNADETPP